MQCPLEVCLWRTTRQSSPFGRVRRWTLTRCGSSWSEMRTMTPSPPVHWVEQMLPSSQLLWIPFWGVLWHSTETRTSMRETRSSSSVWREWPSFWLRLGCDALVDFRESGRLFWKFGTLVIRRALKQKGAKSKKQNQNLYQQNGPKEVFIVFSRDSENKFLKSFVQFCWNPPPSKKLDPSPM